MITRGIWLQALIICFCSGCGAVSQKVTSFMGGEDNATPPTELTDIEQRHKIDMLWDTDIGDGADAQYLKLVPVYVDGRIFVVNSEGIVEAVDATSGKNLWETELEDTRITGGPGVGENLVLVGTDKAEVITMAADTGKILWRGRVSSEVLSAPQPAGKIIVVRTIDGKIFGLDSQDGKRLWTYEQSVPALTLRGTSSPVIAGNYLVAGFDEGRLAAIELETGKVAWDTRIVIGSGRTELERMIDIDAEPVIMDNMIYVATFQGRIAALALDTGRIVWSREISSYAGLCVDEKAIYVTDDDSAIWALDRTTGNSLWKQEKLTARSLTAPAISGDMIVTGDMEGYVHWIDKATGELAARERISKSRIIARPITAGGSVYIYDTDGTLAAYTTQPSTPDNK